MDPKTKVLDLAKQYFAEINEFRKVLHANPELSFQEFETSRRIKKKLKEIGIPFEENWAGTGIVGWIEGKKPSSNCLALRADMDALPITEKNQTNYVSKNPGVMHACGHDVHSSCLLGAAKILNELKEQWSGKVIFIFQPAEEKFPGGASILIKEGLLEKFQPKKIIAQHVYPELEVGKLGFREGMYMASADEIYIQVKGKGGHGALPQQNIDPVIISAHLLLALQNVTSRFAPPTVPSVLSFGKVEAKGATNVIPDDVFIEGTFRTMNEEWRSKAHELIENIAKSTAKSFGGDCEIEIKKGYPFLQNDKGLTQSARKAARELLGEDKIVELDLRMTAEDFSYYSQEMPSCFYRLGVGNVKKGISASVHSPNFDIDEKAIEIGMASMAFIALKELG